MISTMRKIFLPTLDRLVHGPSRVKNSVDRICQANRSLTNVKSLQILLSLLSIDYEKRMIYIVGVNRKHRTITAEVPFEIHEENEFSPDSTYRLVPLDPNDVVTRIRKHLEKNDYGQDDTIEATVKACVITNENNNAHWNVTITLTNGYGIFDVNFPARMERYL